MALRVTNLTNGERLMIWRRREGSTQSDCADMYDVPAYVYCAWEMDASANRAAPKVPVGKLAPYEKCFLLRKRKGWTLPQFQKASGIARQWVTLCERGRCVPTRLVEFWESQ